MKRLRMGQEQNAAHLLKERLWWIVAACLATLAAMGLFLALALPRDNIDELLRAIDAAHVVPDGENAARIYTELAWDPNLPAPWRWTQLPDGSDVTLRQPWRSAEYPQTVEWIKAHQAVLPVLLEASRKPRCWFSVFEARWQSQRRTEAASKWSPLLLYAANNDLGEGRVEAGLEKLFCQLRLAQHFCCQGTPWEYQAGVGMTWTGLRRFARLVVTEEVTPEWLAKLETALPPIEDTLREKLRQLDEVRMLYEQEYPRTFRARLKSIFFPKKRSAEVDESDLLFLGQCRAARILLALRRYKNDTRAWPADLRAFGTSLPAEALLDPLSGKPFAYRLRRDGFLLYSLSVNGTDEGGKPRDDFLFWPDH